MHTNIQTQKVGIIKCTGVWALLISVKTAKVGGSTTIFKKHIIPWTLVVYFIYGFSSFEIVLPKLLPKAQWGLKIEDSARAINRFVCIIIDFLQGNNWHIFLIRRKIILIFDFQYINILVSLKLKFFHPILTQYDYLSS